MRPPATPEEAVVDAALFDPLGAARLLGVFATRGCARVRSGLLADISRKENLPSQRLQSLLAALCASGIITADADGFVLAVDTEEALRHAAVVRGVAYAQYRHRDANQVEITLSPPFLSQLFNAKST